MLSNKPFYYNMTRKYIVAFAHIFNDLHVVRENSAGEVIKDITVPITYAGKRKFAQRLQRSIDKKVSVILPRMAFLITGMTPDNTRRMNELVTIDTPSGDFLYNPAPYNFNIDLSIWAKNMDDILQIVEQSIIFFKPSYTIKVKEIPSLDIERNISITLNSVDFEVDTDLDEENDRTLLASMNFTLKGFLYPPISDSSVIEIINVKFINEEGAALTNINQVWDDLNQDVIENNTDVPDAEWSD